MLDLELITDNKQSNFWHIIIWNVKVDGRPYKLTSFCVSEFTVCAQHLLQHLSAVSSLIFNVYLLQSGPITK